MHEYQFRLPSALITPRISPPTHGRLRTRSSSSGPRRGRNGSRSLCLRRLISVNAKLVECGVVDVALRVCVFVWDGTVVDDSFVLCVLAYDTDVRLWLADR